MIINNVSVMRSAFHKYLHPKEVFISEGVIVKDLIKKKVIQLLYLYFYFIFVSIIDRFIRTSQQFLSEVNRLEYHQNQ
jgi:hypothetical protein